MLRRHTPGFAKPWPKPYLALVPPYPSCIPSRSPRLHPCQFTCLPTLPTHFTSPLALSPPPPQPPSHPLPQILRRLVLFGHPSDSKSLQPVPTVNACMPAMVDVLERMLALSTSNTKQDGASGAGGGAGQGAKPASASRSHLHAMLDRGVLKVLKMQLQVLEMHPW